MPNNDAHFNSAIRQAKRYAGDRIGWQCFVAIGMHMTIIKRLKQ
jgi:hypothetical protein